jgi:hypothetical protein
MSERDAITDAIAGLQVLLVQWDQVAAATARRGEVEASLANVRAAHEKAYAALAEEQRILEAARVKHKLQTAAYEGELAGLIKRCEDKRAEVARLQAAEDQIIANVGSLRKRLGLEVRA